MYKVIKMYKVSPENLVHLDHPVQGANLVHLDGVLAVERQRLLRQDVLARVDARLQRTT
jgi:hypothetical protein